VFSQMGEANLVVRDFVALTPRAARRLWSLLGSHGTIMKTIYWAGPAVEPLLCHLPEQQATIEKAERWMLRIVDVPRALTQRGYAAHVSATLDLDVCDAVIPQNQGRFSLSVEGGEGRVERGGDGALRLDVRALAPLYSGLLTPEELRSVGWLDGTPAALESAARIFAGPQPWMPDHF